MKKIALILSVSLSISLSVFSSSVFSRETNFIDIDQAHQNFDDIDVIVNEYKIMNAFPDKTFRGNNSIDRYTYSVILLNTIDFLNKKMLEIEQEKILETSTPINSETIKYQNISDLDKNHWSYSKAIALLKLGLIRTFSDNTFRGEKTVDYIGFAIGIGRLMNIIYDDAPPVLKRKWQKEITHHVQSIKGIPEDSPVYEPLKLAIENNLIDAKPGNGLTKPITRYDVADYIIRVINKLDELRKYIVFTRI